MSIATLRESLPGVTMRYEEGGMVQIYKYRDREIKFGPSATPAEVVAAFKDSK